MKRIALTRDFYTLVDDADFKELNRYQWQVIMPGGPEGRKYAIRFESGKAVYMHRQLLKDQFTPERPQCDHINGNGLDNQRANLRPATRQENQRNRGVQARKNRSSKFKGVTKTKSGWTAGINITTNRRRYLGTFRDEESAALEYDRAAIEHYGQFARPNFPQEAR